MLGLGETRAGDVDPWVMCLSFSQVHWKGWAGKGKDSSPGITPAGCCDFTSEYNYTLFISKIW